MTPTFLVALPMLVFAGAIMMLIPHFSPRRYFFAITAPQGFGLTDEGRAISRFYHWGVVADVAVAALLMYLIGNARPGLVPLAAFLVPFVGGLAQFLAARRQARRFAVVTGVREAGIEAEDDRIPRWFALALPAFAFPMAAALYLQAHWDEIPARVPMHFDLHGQADRWVDKSAGAVYGILAVSTGLLMMILLTGLATYYGSRRLPQRVIILKFLVATCYYVSLIFAATALMPVIGFSPLWVVLPAPLLVLLLGIWTYKIARDPSLPSEVTPDNCWYLGMIYANSQDPAIFVQRRMGFGYTLNFGNGLSWLFLAAFAITIVVMLRLLQ